MPLEWRRVKSWATVCRHRLHAPPPATKDRQAAEEEDPGGGGPAIEQQGTASREWSR